MSIFWDKYMSIKFLNDLDARYNNFLIILRVSANINNNLLSINALIQRISDKDCQQRDNIKLNTV